MAGQENGFFFFRIKHTLFSSCGFFLWAFFFSSPQIKFVTTMEIPFKSDLGRTDSKRQPRHHPPVQHGLPQPFWDRAARRSRAGPAGAGAGRSAGVKIKGCRRPWERLLGVMAEGDWGERAGTGGCCGSPLGCAGKAGAESCRTSGAARHGQSSVAEVWEPRAGLR